MTNPHFTNVYGVPEWPVDEPYSFESISYTAPTVQANTVFREPMQAPPMEWYWPDGTWIQHTPLSLRSSRVYFRAPMQAPNPWDEVWNWMPAWSPNNLAPLHATIPAGAGHRPIGSEFAGRPDKIIGSHIARRYQ